MLRGSVRPVIDHITGVELDVPSLLRLHSPPNPPGQEEVPENVVAVLTSAECPDILSHSAVRARNMSVLMAACFDDTVRGACDTSSARMQNGGSFGNFV